MAPLAVEGGTHSALLYRGPAELLAGVVPFLVGDALKIALAAGLLPATWKLVGHRR